MNIIVCIKQVPDTNEIRIDPETKSLIREGVPSIVNTYDMYALEAAARIKDDDPGTMITALTMGPSGAEKALRECLAVAADEAWLICGREFAGSDTMATSYVLSTAIKNIEEMKGIKFDAVFCGKQAIDGDTAQVGPALAELLGYPYVTYTVRARMDGNNLIAEREAMTDREMKEISLPCLITFTKPQYAPRLPTLTRRMKARKAEIRILEASNMTGLDPERIGLEGSPTRVVRTEVAGEERESIIISEGSEEDSAIKLAEILSARGLIGEAVNNG